jgi:hypothetical protein
MDLLLWGVLPYVMVAVLIGGSIWRYRYDQFGWTTRSSQLYESRLLRIGSLIFHSPAGRKMPVSVPVARSTGSTRPTVRCSSWPAGSSGLPTSRCRSAPD